MGPMGVVPLSAYDQLHPLEDDNGNWTGVLQDKVVNSVPTHKAIYARDVKAGTVTVHNARCVHGSRPNISPRNRPLLLNTFTAATAHHLPAGTNLLHLKSKRQMRIIRGQPTNIAVFDPRPCPMAPNFEAGYTPTFFADDRRTEGAEGGRE